MLLATKVSNINNDRSQFERKSHNFVQGLLDKVNNTFIIPCVESSIYATLKDVHGS